MDTTRSHLLFEQAQQYIPGGVNSPVRAYQDIGIPPLFIKKAQGANIWDVDGNSYIDYVASWGPMILGHAHPAILEAVIATANDGLSFGAPCENELKLAQLVTEMTGVEMIRMVNSGTEAVMSALRLARGVTKRAGIIKFEGCYHGHTDSMLVKAGSGLLTAGTPSSAGVPVAMTADTHIAQYNDLNSVEALFKQHPNAIAAVIIEPVAANMGLVAPQQGFLQGLRSLCDQYGALLIFDEVITGFRLAAGGAQAYYNIKADLVTYGKIIGGGLPVGAYGGKKEYLDHVAPCGDVYQAGTLSGNPVAMAAGISQLKLLKEQAHTLYPELEKKTRQFTQAMQQAADNAGVKLHINQVGSLCCVYFTPTPVTCYQQAISADKNLFRAYFKEMLKRGIYLAPSQFEAMFIGVAHTPELISKTLEAFTETMEKLKTFSN